MSSEQFVCVKDLKPGQKNLNLLFIVLEIGGFCLLIYSIFGLRCNAMLQSLGYIHMKAQSIILQEMLCELKMDTTLDLVVWLIKPAQ